MPTIPSPNRVGKYDILELVGEGAMGSVYRARDPVLNRDIAVKVMSDAIARDAELRGRFMREAQAAASLQHPNVVTVYDFGEYEGHLFIAMEFVVGDDLEVVLKRGDELSLDRKLAIAVDVLVGLSYAHRHGVVHRDIKPANIRLTDLDTAKIMDFGVAHLESAGMTKTGVMLGTPNYMAPEQVTGSRVSPATDIFSLGAVLFEMLTGRKAFGAESLHNVLLKVVSEDPPPVDALVSGLPPELSPIVRRALAKEPSDRFQTAVDMADALTAIRSRLGAHTTAETISLGSSFSRRATRRRTSNATLLVSAALGATVVAVAAYGIGRQRSIQAADSVAAAEVATASVDSPITAPATAVPPDTVVVPPPITPRAPPSPTAARIDPGAVAREARMYVSVRTSALEERARAADRGADPASLAQGDSRLASADAHSRAGRNPEAVQAVHAAGSLWREAGRTAARLASAERNAADRDTQVTVTTPPIVVPPARPPAEEQRPPPKADPVAAPARGTSPDSIALRRAADAPAELTALIARYARALESRDVNAVRRVFPGLPAADARRFDEFFSSVRSLTVRLSGSPADVRGTSATSRLSGTYAFVDPSGRAQRQEVSFPATFVHDGSQWLFASIR
jgi:serine/threonine-protein kinase